MKFPQYLFAAFPVLTVVLLPSTESGTWKTGQSNKNGHSLQVPPVGTAYYIFLVGWFPNESQVNRRQGCGQG